MTATPTDAINPVAYLHNVAFGDEETDQALSFKAESFPLEGVAGYRKVSCEPLILQSAHDKAQSDLKVYYEHLLRAANARADGFLKAAQGVETWWLEQGMHELHGAPHAIFALREAIALSAPPAAKATST